MHFNVLVLYGMIKAFKCAFEAYLEYFFRTVGQPKKSIKEEDIAKICIVNE